MSVVSNLSVSGGDANVSEVPATVLPDENNLLGYQTLEEVAVDYDAYYDSAYHAYMDALADYEMAAQPIPDYCLDYFSGILCNRILPVDYVVYPGDEYEVSFEDGTSITYNEYCMAYGDLEENYQHFTGEDCTVVSVRYYDELSVEVEHDQEIDMSVSYRKGYSNLGDYSGIYSYDWMGLCVLLLVLIFGLVWTFKKLHRMNY